VHLLCVVCYNESVRWDYYFEYNMFLLELYFLISYEGFDYEKACCAFGVCSLWRF
jgi:hypothetical protein